MISAALLSLLAHAGLVELAGRLRVQSPDRASQIFVTMLEAAPPPPPPAAPVANGWSGPGDAVRKERPREPAKAKIARRVEARERSRSSQPRPQVMRAGNAASGTSEGMAGGVAGRVLGGGGRTLYRADEVASPPFPIIQTRPDYPPLARARGIEGLVVIEAVVDQRGHIEPASLRVVHSVPVLEEAALRAVEKWKFQPGRNGSGDAVRVLVQVPIRFRLR